MEIKPLKPSELRWICPENIFKFDKNGKVAPSDKIVGQDRAVKAVKLGLEIVNSGYNMFVTGVSGSGRETTVKRILDQIDTTTNDLTDLCYVYNFEDSKRPQALSFPAGDGEKFKEEVESCIELLRKNIPVVLSSESTAIEKNSLLDVFSEKKKEQMRKIEVAAEEASFTIVSLPTAQGKTRPDVLPVIDGEAYTYEQINQLIAEGKVTKEKLIEYRETHTYLFKLLSSAIRKSQSIEIKAQIELNKLYRRILRPTVLGILDRLSEFGDKDVAEFIDNIAETILSNIGVFASDSEEADPYIVFDINLVVNNAGKKKRPIVVEQFPDTVRLFGTIDRIIIDNKPYSDHSMIRAGSFLRANGGYLIINATDVVRQPGLWQTLIQTIRNKTLIIRPNEYSRNYMAIELQPEPIEIDVKVVLIGPSWLYNSLASQDPDFGFLFRVRADFEYSMKLTKETLNDFAGVIAYICNTESVLPLDKGAMAAIAEKAVKIAGRHDEISLQFNRIADYVRQASYWALQSGKKTITAVDIVKAIKEKHYRLSIGEDHATDRILENQVMVDTEGLAIGQLNGLAVYSGVDHSFGLPSRITATVSPGIEGIVNVERESDMSGSIHTKGVLVITGFLREHFANDYPISLSAGIVFEQSYGGVDGDSASSTELYTLLSALAEIPLRQDLAVTGSVNQHGKIQPIGGVNYKIEGFFKICQKRGLTGTQGVMIPSSNVIHLQLNKEIVAAVASGKFHIYSISTIEQGIELLTGVSAGKRSSHRTYPDDTIFGMVDTRLRKMAEIVRDFGGRN